MKFVLGFLLGLAVGAVAAAVIASRRGQDEDEAMWAGEDTAQPPAETTPEGVAT